MKLSTDALSKEMWRQVVIVRRVVFAEEGVSEGLARRNPLRWLWLKQSAYKV
jgi:hypothetical protein